MNAKNLLRFAAALIAGTALPAAAQVVNGGAPNGGASWDIFDDNRTATSFAITSPITFDAVRFWGIMFQGTPYSPNMYWQILSDVEGTPSTSAVAEGNAVATSTLRTELKSAAGAYSWQFDFSTGTQTLAAGVYWLALHDGSLDPSGFTGSSMIWETSSEAGEYAVQTFTIDEAWNPGGDSGLAYQLRSNVVATPEPGTLALFGTGLFGVLGAGVRTRRRGLRSLAPMLGLVAMMSARRVEAQEAPKVIYACYVPLTGTVYRVKEPDLKQTCTSPAHVAFSWTDGAGSGGVTSHGALSGLTNDDHPQYLLGDGVRSTVNGFAVTGTFGSGAIPVSGPGARMMWYPGKAAFRAGSAQNPGVWDDANIGEYSVGMGRDNLATGMGATSIGFLTLATNTGAVALGFGSSAGGLGSFAAGNSANASGPSSVAVGLGARATGIGSVAIGPLANSVSDGSTVFGDRSGPGFFSTAANQFSARASGGFRFRTAGDLSTGCDLPAGSGTWSCTSSRLAKEHFENLNGDDVLAKIDGMAIQAWSYRTEPGDVRHVGPTAQDFRAAFGLGTSDQAISLVDIDGVNMLGVQALTRRVNTQAREIETLRAEHARESAEQAARIAALERAIERLTAGGRP